MTVIVGADNSTLKLSQLGRDQLRRAIIDMLARDETNRRMLWKKTRQRRGLARSRAVYSTITAFDERNLEWCVYRVATKVWAIGVGIVGEHGLHTVIKYEASFTNARDTVTALATLLNHEW